MSEMRLAAAAALLVGWGALASPAVAQTRAEGAYPGVVVCDPLPFSRGPMREAVTLTIANGEARYARKLSGQDSAAAAGAVETGRGPLTNGQLTLVGSASGTGFAYEARYAGAVDGRGGVLIGTQTWTVKGQTARRTCQITLGGR